MPWGEEPTIGSDVKTVTLTLASGDFRFDWARVVDKAGVERGVFGEGEMVYMDVKATNKGDVPAKAEFTITDIDTGEVIVVAHSGMLDPGKHWGITGEVGYMPDRDWHLEFRVTP